MPQASILFDGNPGPYTNISVGVGVTISNDNIGGEFLYDYTLTKKPTGSSATLVGAGATRTLTPDEYGTYVIELVVNNDPSLTDTSAAAALYEPSNMRQPAVRETLDFNSTEGWAAAMRDLWERSNHGVGPRPAAAVSELGKIWHTLGGAGVEDAFEICLKDAADTYAWYDLIGGFLRFHDLSADTTLTSAQCNGGIISVDPTGGLVTLELPDLTADEDLHRFRVLNENGTNPVRIALSGSPGYQLFYRTAGFTTSFYSLVSAGDNIEVLYRNSNQTFYILD